MAARRGVRLVLSLIGLAVVISMVAVVLMFFAASRGPSVPSSATLILRPGGDLPEVEPDDVVGQVFGRDVNTVRGFVDALHKASRDSRVRSVLLMPSTLELPYWGKVQEMRDAVTAFRKSGKKVTAFLEYGGDREYYLASAADRVFLMPIKLTRPDGRRLVRDVPARHVRQDRRVSGLRAHRRLQVGAQSIHAERIYAGAPRDGAVAQPRHVRTARERHRRGPEEERG